MAFLGLFKSNEERLLDEVVDSIMQVEGVVHGIIAYIESETDKPQRREIAKIAVRAIMDTPLSDHGVNLLAGGTKGSSADRQPDYLGKSLGFCLLSAWLAGVRAPMYRGGLGVKVAAIEGRILGFIQRAGVQGWDPCYSIDLDDIRAMRAAFLQREGGFGGNVATTQNLAAEQEARRVRDVREVPQSHTAHSTVPSNTADAADGNGTTRGSTASLESLQRSGAQGDANAQHILGQMYAKGDGVPQDFDTAARWWANAARQGHSESQYNLGVAYAKGLGREKDLVLAHAWLSIANLAGKAGAEKNRDVVQTHLSTNELAEARNLSTGWRRGQDLVRQ